MGHTTDASSAQDRVKLSLCSRQQSKSCAFFATNTSSIGVHVIQGPESVRLARQVGYRTKYPVEIDSQTRTYARHSIAPTRCPSTDHIRLPVGRTLSAYTHMRTSQQKSAPSPKCYAPGARRTGPSLTGWTREEPRLRTVPRPPAFGQKDDRSAFVQ